MPEIEDLTHALEEIRMRRYLNEFSSGEKEEGIQRGLLQGISGGAIE